MCSHHIKQDLFVENNVYLLAKANRKRLINQSYLFICKLFGSSKRLITMLKYVI